MNVYLINCVHFLNDVLLSFFCSHLTPNTRTVSLHLPVLWTSRWCLRLSFSRTTLVVFFSFPTLSFGSETSSWPVPSERETLGPSSCGSLLVEMEVFLQFQGLLSGWGLPSPLWICNSRINANNKYLFTIKLEWFWTVLWGIWLIF